MENKITAIVLAAGQGKRMNSPVAKQFLTLQNKPVVYYSLKAFEESIVADIVLVTGKEMLQYCKEEIVDRYHFHKVSKIIEGGKERYDSVYQALKAIHSDYVLIHDGARPFITAELIRTIVEQVKISKACIVGTPVKETIKVVDKDGLITATPNRKTLWSAQTPQAFDYSLIRSAYDKLFLADNIGELGITDDAMVFEAFQNKPVKMIMGDYNNIKLTTPEDLSHAEEILKNLIVRK